jgi:hypothetical protein
MFMFRRMALFVVMAGFVTALLPRQSKSQGTCTYVPEPMPVEPANTWLTKSSISISFMETTTLHYQFSDEDRCRYADWSFGPPGYDKIQRDSYAEDWTPLTAIDLTDSVQWDYDAESTFVGEEPASSVRIHTEATDAGNFADDPDDGVFGADQFVEVLP